MHSQEDLDHEFLNLDAYFAATNNDDDIWSTASQGTDTRLEVDDEELLEHARAHAGDDGEVPRAPSNSIMSLVPASVAGGGGGGGVKGGGTNSGSQTAVKKETTPEHSQHDEDDCGGCCGCDDADEQLEIKTESAAGDAAANSGPGSMDMLDDGTWLDFDPQMTGAALASPTLMRRFGMENRPSSTTAAESKMDHDLLCDEDDDDSFLLGDDMDLPDFSDADVAGLVPSPIAGGSRLDTLTVSTSSSSSGREAMPHHNHLLSPVGGGAMIAPLPSPSVFPGHSNSSVLVSDQDIPDMVNLFSSMYSPSESQRHQQALAMHQAAQNHQNHHQNHHHNHHENQNQQTPLSIMVPTPQTLGAMFPFTNIGSPLPVQNHSQHSQSSAASQSNMHGNPFEYFTPPGVTGNNRVLDPNSIFLNADLMSPPSKNTSVFQQVQHGQRSMTQTQAQQQMQAATAAAVAMANSAAAMNTMRKLNATYGVPIAPLQRSITADALPLKPKILSATATSASTIAATFGSSSKVSKISITPDISDFKLVQIFHNFCDPASKILTLQRFHQLLQFHQVKDDHVTTQAAAAAANKTNGGSTAASTAASATPTAETQTLFKTLDKKNAGVLDLEAFMSSFQICNRCTEAKRRAHSAVCAAQGQSFVSTALERQLMEDVAPVIVRVVPTSYEGSKVKSCEHYQWTWCEGFDKTGNEKCKGTNRHDKCPKYLANCTLWKHKLPPKNRKSKVFENIESPSKKFKHFA